MPLQNFTLLVIIMDYATLLNWVATILHFHPSFIASWIYGYQMNINNYEYRNEKSYSLTGQKLCDHARTYGEGI